jgi:hypothetical protein
VVIAGFRCAPEIEAVTYTAASSAKPKAMLIAMSSGTLNRPWACSLCVESTIAVPPKTKTNVPTSSATHAATLAVATEGPLPTWSD